MPPLRMLSSGAAIGTLEELGWTRQCLRGVYAIAASSVFKVLLGVFLYFGCECWCFGDDREGALLNEHQPSPEN